MRNTSRVSAVIELTVVSNGTITFLLPIIRNYSQSAFRLGYLFNVIKYDVQNVYSNSVEITA